MKEVKYSEEFKKVLEGKPSDNYYSKLFQFLYHAFASTQFPPAPSHIGWGLLYLFPIECSLILDYMREGYVSEVYDHIFEPENSYLKEKLTWWKKEIPMGQLLPLAMEEDMLAHVDGSHKCWMTDIHIMKFIYFVNFGTILRYRETLRAGNDLPSEMQAILHFHRERGIYQ